MYRTSRATLPDAAGCFERDPSRSSEPVRKPQITQHKLEVNAVDAVQICLAATRDIALKCDCLAHSARVLAI